MPERSCVAEAINRENIKLFFLPANGDAIIIVIIIIIIFICQTHKHKFYNTHTR